ncbi:hypothetical protein PsorP6_011440 [Peronosclerospora sorghi]|uniref:Uncharacterized protein n=1 Tax=Peronosclerospora sorghi TaxID=230839 RepID=A0ACC0WJQ8_9STRA|nr:hypothetical protein PsorP6_011440 [Peronosclerospora sorghi]
MHWMEAQHTHTNVKSTWTHTHREAASRFFGYRDDRINHQVKIAAASTGCIKVVGPRKTKLHARIEEFLDLRSFELLHGHIMLPGHLPRPFLHLPAFKVRCQGSYDHVCEQKNKNTQAPSDEINPEDVPSDKTTSTYVQYSMAL